MLSPLYGQLSPLRIPTKAGRSPVSDSDAEAYLQAVEGADGLQLEQLVADSINSFVLGCKSDGIWSAIKASCILAGARSLSGAIVPLVGASPNNNNFVSADYNRKTGLKGNGSTKTINPNRNNNSDPQNSKHIAVYVSQFHTRNVSRIDLGVNVVSVGSTHLRTAPSPDRRATRVNYSTSTLYNEATSNPGLWAASRYSAAGHHERFNQSTLNFSTNSAVPLAGALTVFTSSDARLSFYSIGESLDLALLDTRVSTLMTALAAAI